MLHCHVTPNQAIFILVDIYWIVNVKLQEYIISCSLFLSIHNNWWEINPSAFSQRWQRLLRRWICRVLTLEHDWVNHYYKIVALLLLCTGGVHTEVVENVWGSLEIIWEGVCVLGCSSSACFTLKMKRLLQPLQWCRRWTGAVHDSCHS